MNITKDLFKGYYIPVPKQDTYFCMYSQELVNLKVYNFETGGDKRETGEIYILDCIDGEYFINETKEYFWFEYDQENYDVYEKVQEYFTNERFKEILQLLYNELLEGKPMIDTMYEMMFLQQMCYISNYDYNF